MNVLSDLELLTCQLTANSLCVAWVEFYAVLNKGMLATRSLELRTDLVDRTTVFPLSVFVTTLDVILRVSR
ncbi:hypothetical protein D3C87_2056510 [compost metagenome]